MIGSSVTKEERVEMLLFLVQNIDVFAWNPYEVPGVDPYEVPGVDPYEVPGMDPEFIVHKFNVDPLYLPKK